MDIGDKMATNHAIARYMEIVDLQTVDNKLSVIGIHTPVGKSPYEKLRGFFMQFKKYKYNGIKKILIRPASGLPIDPLGLSVQVGSADALNPRDAFNPILFKGCHGEHLHQILDSLMDTNEYVQGGGFAYSGGDPSPVANGPALADEASPSLRKKEIDFSLAEAYYYQWLTDPSWRKFGIQSPISLRNLHPLVWKMSRNAPMLPSATGSAYDTNAGEITPFNNSSGAHVSPDTGISIIGNNLGNANPIGQVGGVLAPTGDSQTPWAERNQYVQEFTNGVTRLGWLPTTIRVQGSASPRISALPKLFMGMLILPPCYSVAQFMRAVIVHEFEFKDFTASDGAFDPYVVLPSTPTSTNPAVGGSYVNMIDYAVSKGDTLDVFNGSVENMSDGVA